MKIDPSLDLVLERVVDVAPELVWAAWTQAEHLKRWFTPHPWQTVDAEVDLRPGGLFRTVMRSPEGEDTTNLCCYLEVIPGKRLVWTDALEANYRPSRSRNHPFRITASIVIEPHRSGTKYTAVVMHDDKGSRARHEEMGFHDGWGTAFDQLVEHVKREAVR